MIHGQYIQDWISVAHKIPPHVCKIEAWGAAIGIGATAGAIVGGTVVGGVASSLISSSATNNATEAAQQTAASQIALQQQENQQIVGNLAPYRNASNTALNSLVTGFAPGGQFTKQFTPTDFTKSPEYAGYQFEQKQGEAAINQEAAATGMSGTPATVQALEQYNQGLASTQYQNWYDQAYQQWLNSQAQQISGEENLANLGENAAAQTGAQTQAGVGNEIQALSSAGNAQVAAAIAQGKNITSTIGSLTGTLTNPSISSQLFNQNPVVPADTSPSLGADTPAEVAATTPQTDQIFSSQQLGPI